MDAVDRIDRRLRYLTRRRDEAIAELNATQATEYDKLIDAELQRRHELRTVSA